MTSYGAVFAGFLPLAVKIVLLDELTTEWGVGLINTLGMAVNAGVLASTAGTWRGRRKAMTLFLTCLILHYLAVGAISFSTYSTAGMSDDQRNLLIGRMGRGVLFPLFYLWYFLRPTTQEYYTN
jgi:hypothetical protein